MSAIESASFTFRSDRHEDTQSCTPGDQRLPTEVATAAAPVPLAEAEVPGERLVSMDPPGSSQHVVHVDFVSKLGLSVLQQDSLSEHGKSQAEEPTIEQTNHIGLRLLPAYKIMSE